MNYAVVKVTDGNYNIHAEGVTNVSKAKISFHSLCSALWNDAKTSDATVMIVDENLDCVEGYKESIHKTAVPTEE